MHVPASPEERPPPAPLLGQCSRPSVAPARERPRAGEPRLDSAARGCSALNWAGLRSRHARTYSARRAAAATAIAVAAATEFTAAPRAAARAHV
eukprot:scaffold283_cov110-Isochrysis_galbana.AAC.2